MNIALLGFGTVGKGVFNILKRNKTDHFNLKYILIKKYKKKFLSEMTSNIKDILQDPELNIVIEVMGGLELAHTYILEALRHRKNVITANKAVIALYLKEFNSVAYQNHVKFYFESSVGGGIPWIQGLERALRIDKIRKIQGIFNGTSNFILDQMKFNKQTFSEVLTKAQKLGYAEKDPSSDIEGFDIANKLCINIDIAYNIFLPPQKKLPISGIQNVSLEDISFFQKLGLVIKLVGKSKRIGDKFDYAVEPTLFAPNTLEANTFDNYNLITLSGKTIGNLRFVGQGAGQLPTANAVIQDALDIFQHKNHLKRNFQSSLSFNPNLIKKNYLLKTKVDPRFLPGFFANFLGRYFLFKDTSTEDMHKLLQNILPYDSQAFIACFNSEDLNFNNSRKQENRHKIFQIINKTASLK